MLRITDTAKKTVRVRVTGTARRWRGGRTQSRNLAYGLSGQGWAAWAQRTMAGAEGGHGEKVEGRADGHVLQTSHPTDTAKEAMRVQVASTARRWRGGRQDKKRRDKTAWPPTRAQP